MNMQTRSRLTLIALACTAALGMAACDKSGSNTTAGEKVDAAVSTMEKKADTAGAEIKKGMDTAGTEIKQGVEAAKDSASKAVDTASDAARDAGITTQINADLARDPDLSALKINVDTVAGKVVLKGTAPTDAAKERATSKAQAVSGVTSVDNQLRVGS